MLVGMTEEPANDDLETSPSSRTVRSEGDFPIAEWTGGGVVSRLVFLGLAVVPSVVFYIALQLTPDPLGHSTHTQLGLPPCGFLELTGVLCPGCGLTTSFSHMVRLDFVGAAHANPFGIPLFIFSAACIPVSLVAMVRGWSVVEVLVRFHIDKFCVGLALTCLLVWVVRLASPLVAGPW